MPQNPAFSLTGNLFYDDTAVSFEVVFQNTGDESLTQAYEWYLDGVLIIKSGGVQFAGHIACGLHTIGVRLLYQNSWTGIQELEIETCKAVSASFISGPDTINAGNTAAYSVITVFTDGTSADVTKEYIFTSTAGGSFSGNIFTAAENEEASIPVTITATKDESTPLTKGITILNPGAVSPGILVVDIYNNNTLNVIALIDNAEVAESHIAAYTGVNIIPLGASVAGALIVASDYISQPSLNWRFLFNVLKLRNDYPLSQTFVFYIKGRAVTAAVLSGAYSLKSDDATMILTGSAGSYIPGTSGGDNLINPTNFSGNVVSGANGSYAESDLTTIIKITFTVADNSITYITN